MIYKKKASAAPMLIVLVRCVRVLLISNTTTTTTKSFSPPLSSFCDLTSGADERKRTRLETADAAAASSDCDAISGAAVLAALSATPPSSPDAGSCSGR